MREWVGLWRLWACGRVGAGVGEGMVYTEHTKPRHYKWALVGLWVLGTLGGLWVLGTLGGLWVPTGYIGWSVGTEYTGWSVGTGYTGWSVGTGYWVRTSGSCSPSPGRPGS